MRKSPEKSIPNKKEYRKKMARGAIRTGLAVGLASWAFNPDSAGAQNLRGDNPRGIFPKPQARLITDVKKVEPPLGIVFEDSTEKPQIQKAMEKHPRPLDVKKGPDPFEFCLNLAHEKGFTGTSIKDVKKFIQSVQFLSGVDSLAIINYHFPNFLQYGKENNLHSLEEILKLWEITWKKYYLWQAMIRGYKKAGGVHERVNDYFKKIFAKLCQQAELPFQKGEKLPPKIPAKNLPTRRDPGYSAPLIKGSTAAKPTS